MLKNSNKVKKAFDVIKQAMIDDNPNTQGSFAHTWHCNIAMMCTDAILKYDTGMYKMNVSRVYDISNDAASRFMKLCFDVETIA